MTSLNTAGDEFSLSTIPIRLSAFFDATFRADFPHHFVGAFRGVTNSLIRTRSELASTPIIVVPFDTHCVALYGTSKASRIAIYSFILSFVRAVIHSFIHGFKRSLARRVPYN